MIIRFLKKRSILFYIFWISFLIGEATLHILSTIKGCIVLPSVKNEYFTPNIRSCDLIETIFVEACIFVCIFAVATYFIWYVFKCFRFIFKLGFRK